MNEERTAIVLGATGLVGSELVGQLLDDPGIARVIALTRRPIERRHAKLSVEVVDLRDPASFADRVRGDVLYSALGTTKKKAGSNEAHREVDHTFQLRVAEAATANGVPAYALVSATGANPRASTFYFRMRGDLEVDIQKLPFARVRILRPGFLDGERAEARPGEETAVAVLRVVGWLPGLRGMRPIPAATVARALRAAIADETPGVRIYPGAELFELGRATVSR